MVGNWPIRRKLAIVLVVPLVTLVVLTVNQVGGNLDNVRASHHVRTLAGFSILVNDLIDRLERERVATATYVGSGYATGAADAVSVRKPVDAARETLEAAAGTLPLGSDSRLGNALTAAQRAFSRLPSQRQLVTAGGPLGSTAKR